MPAETEPLDVAANRIDILLFFLCRVGVVEAQVAVSAIIARDTEIQANRLGVADMQVSVGFRRKTRDDT